LRKQDKMEFGQKTEESVMQVPTFDTEDLDIPTFLRKR
jgi:hypothetical protein